MVGYVLCLGKVGRYRERGDEVRVELEGYLCNLAFMGNRTKAHDLLVFFQNVQNYNFITLCLKNRTVRDILQTVTDQIMAEFSVDPTGVVQFRPKRQLTQQIQPQQRIRTPKS